MWKPGGHLGPASRRYRTGTRRRQGVVAAALAHDVLAVPAGARRYRELPVMVRLDDGTLADGRIDFAWSDGQSGPSLTTRPIARRNATSHKSRRTLWPYTVRPGCLSEALF